MCKKRKKRKKESDENLLLKTKNQQKKAQDKQTQDQQKVDNIIKNLKELNINIDTNKNIDTNVIEKDNTDILNELNINKKNYLENYDKEIENMLEKIDKININNYNLIDKEIDMINMINNKPLSKGEKEMIDNVKNLEFTTSDKNKKLWKELGLDTDSDSDSEMEYQTIQNELTEEQKFNLENLRFQNKNIFDNQNPDYIPQ